MNENMKALCFFPHKKPEVHTMKNHATSLENPKWYMKYTKRPHFEAEFIILENGQIIKERDPNQTYKFDELMQIYEEPISFSAYYIR